MANHVHSTLAINRHKEESRHGEQTLTHAQCTLPFTHNTRSIYNKRMNNHTLLDWVWHNKFMTVAMVKTLFIQLLTLSVHKGRT